MTSNDPSQSRIELYDSALTLPSDSENYSANNDLSPSAHSRQSEVAVYKPPTLWRLLRGAAVNLLLPFVNGLMLGLGELLAHETAFRLGWSNTKVRLSSSVHAGLRTGGHAHEWLGLNNKIKDGLLILSLYCDRYFPRVDDRSRQGRVLKCAKLLRPGERGTVLSTWAVRRRSSECGFDAIRQH